MFKVRLFIPIKNMSLIQGAEVTNLYMLEIFVINIIEYISWKIKITYNKPL